MRAWMVGARTAALLVLIGALSGCARAASPAATPTATAAIPMATLQNLTYRDVHPTPIRLESGSYTGLRHPDDAAPATVILEKTVAYGDLDGDGVDDAAVVLTDAGAGRGTLVYLAAVLAHGDTVENHATVQLGQDFRVDALKIVDGQISVRGETIEEEGSTCCTVVSGTDRIYALQDGSLKLVAADAAAD